MGSVLCKFGFLSNFLQAILALHYLPLAQVFTSGAVSKYFNITNVPCQGCLLSPVIFNLRIEPLAQSVSHSPDIKGVLIGNIKLEYLQTTSLWSSPPTRHLYRLYQTFYTVSALFPTITLMPSNL